MHHGSARSDPAHSQRDELARRSQRGSRNLQRGPNTHTGSHDSAKVVTSAVQIDAPHWTS